MKWKGVISLKTFHVLIFHRWDCQRAPIYCQSSSNIALNGKGKVCHRKLWSSHEQSRHLNHNQFRENHLGYCNTVHPDQYSPSKSHSWNIGTIYTMDDMDHLRTPLNSLHKRPNKMCEHFKVKVLETSFSTYWNWF